MFKSKTKATSKVAFSKRIWNTKLFSGQLASNKFQLLYYAIFLIQNFSFTFQMAYITNHGNFSQRYTFLSTITKAVLGFFEIGYSFGNSAFAFLFSIICMYLALLVVLLCFLVKDTWLIKRSPPKVQSLFSMVKQPHFFCASTFIFNFLFKAVVETTNTAEAVSVVQLVVLFVLCIVNWSFSMLFVSTDSPVMSKSCLSRSNNLNLHIKQFYNLLYGIFMGFLLTSSTIQHSHFTTHCHST